MNFVLCAVNAKYIHSNPALYSLRAYAKQKDESLSEHILLLEYTINHQISHIVADIYKRKPDVLGLSCYIWNISYIFQIVSDIHKLMPDLPIYLGGPEVTYNAREILNAHNEITGIMVGEGEETFYELLSLYVRDVNVDTDLLEDNTIQFREKLSKIAGLVTREGQGTPRPLTNMDDMPFLYENLDEFTNKIIYYESSRGCPFSCSYCLSSIDKTVRLRNLDLVKKELQFFLDHKVKQVKFVDRTFNCNHKHAMEVWKYILENDNCVTNFHFEISADLISQEELEILKQFRPNAIQLEIGVQSTNQKTIEAINRKMDLQKLKYVVDEIHSYGNIHQHLDLIAGLPYEDYETFRVSFNDVFAMRPEQLQLGFLKVLKGSSMAENAEKYGIHFTDRPSYEVLYTNWITYDEILKLKNVEEMVELYYNSGQFRKTLPVLLEQFETPFDFFEKLARYFEEKDLFLNAPSRIYRYEVLADFANKCTNLSKEFVCELLTIDIYLRENSKSRPSFSVDLGTYKEQIRTLYQKEDLKENYLIGYDQYDRRQIARMTHIEPIKYNHATHQKLATTEFLLFDYENRNPLFMDARTISIF